MQIKINGLSKKFANGKFALNQVDLTINNGLFGLLGPNGAGKTTFMNILVTLMQPSTGSISVDGYDLQKKRREIRAMLGYLPQDFNVFPKVKTWEFLDYSARLSGLSVKKERSRAVDDMLEKVGLFDVRERLASKLSGGMKRRLGIAQALINSPKILVVDEPTTGLDPEERIRFRNLLTDMGSGERIIILSTHIVGDISSSCNEMALLNEGRLGFNGHPADLINRAAGHTFQLEANDAGLEAIREKYSVISTVPSLNGWLVEVVANKIDGHKSTEIDPNLEHAYVYFMENQN